MLSESSLDKLEKLIKTGKILGYQESKDGIIILASKKFSDEDRKSLGINIVEIIHIEGKLEALET